MSSLLDDKMNAENSIKKNVLICVNNRKQNTHETKHHIVINGMKWNGRNDGGCSKL